MNCFPAVKLLALGVAIWGASRVLLSVAEPVRISAEPEDEIPLKGSVKLMEEEVAAAFAI